VAHETFTLDRLGRDEKRVPCVAISFEEHNLLVGDADVRLQQFDARAAQTDGEHRMYLEAILEPLRNWKVWTFRYHPDVRRNVDRVRRTRCGALLRGVHVGVETN